MKVLLCLSAALMLATAQDATACVQCLRPVWFSAVDVSKNASERCAAISVDKVMQCLDTCNITPADKPLSYRIRQLTQISDIFYALLVNNCLPSTTGGECNRMMDCVLSVSNYEYDGQTPHSPYSTVFDYNCGLELLAFRVSTSQLTSALEVINILSLGVDAACDEPRRCVKYGNIFEVKPGSECNEYYQEAAAYGPSIGQSQKAAQGKAFDPAVCRIEYLNAFFCPADPAHMPIYSEVPPSQPDPTPKEVIYEPISVNTNSPCEECLHPVWHRAVTTNGSHLCEQSFQSLVYECLANCKCCPNCQTCIGRYEQHKTEVLVKLADINKALEMNQCTGNPSCSAASYQCTENVARFYPSTAPHVTVNTLSCRAEDLVATLDCFSQACDAEVANILSSAVIDGYDPICTTDLRCLTYGNIYEYVPMTELNATAVPCADYRHAPANGWQQPSGVNRVREEYLFNTNGCWPDWPANVNCPAEISASDPMMIK